MNKRGAAIARVLVAVMLAASVITAIVAVAVSAKRIASSRNTAPADIPVSVMSATDEPIPSEADVFRTNAGVLAIDPSSESRRGAHPRTLATYRGLRAFPGVPPRIPHGLTPDEVLRGGCPTCHQRGGYSHRFDAYVPITPHPEMGICLQCHVGDVKLMAIPLPSTDPSARCRQCHSSGGSRWRDSSSTWKSLPWPQLARVEKNIPPPIPHSLEFRGNCVACHAAPSAVQEIRTPHAERANCRQCHLESSRDTSAFVRPQLRAVAGSGGAQ
jgi:cytochrome c-type protein NapB